MATTPAIRAYDDNDKPAKGSDEFCRISIRSAHTRGAGNREMDAAARATPFALNLLGPFSATWKGQALDGFNYDKMRALLAYVALEHRQEHSRETLAALLWESSPPSAWRGNLRRTLSDLRRVLETPTDLTLFATSKNTLQFLPCGEIDALQFLQPPAGCNCQRCDACLAHLEDAASRYRGDLLAGLDLPDCPDFEDWLLLQRESLRCHALALFEHLSNHFEQRGDLQRALPHARRLVELDPWQESGQQRLMRLLALNGQSAAALSQYEAFRGQLLKELGVHPSQDCRDLHQRIRQGEIRAAEVPAVVAAPVALPPPPAELRQVTVLYCELSAPGSSDPEEALSLLATPQAQCIQVIRAHGGYVVQSHGGGLLAYFGYPRAREDAARMAVQAALALPAACEPAQVRCGLHTGQIVTAPSQQIPDATGFTSDLAVQVRQLAGYQEVTLSSATYRLVEGYFRCQPLQLCLLGPGASAGTIYRAEAASAAHHRLAVQPQLTPLTGRDAQLQQLLDLWQQVRASQRCHSLLLSGDPGVGKSRLILELGKTLAVTHPGRQVELRCLEQRSNDPFAPCAELLTSLCGFTAQEDGPARYRKLASILRAFPMAADATDLIADLLGLPLPSESPVPQMLGEMWREQMNEALLAIIRGVSQNEALLLVLEDAHWADASTLNLAERLLHDAADRPLLLLLSARPEFAGQAWESAGAQRLDLPHLSSEQAREMVADLPQDLDPAALQRVLTLADGVPLFIEELVQWAAASQTPNSSIPLTLNDLLMARIDQLGEARHTAQIAACIGREFHAELLEALHPGKPADLHTHLGALLRAGLLSPGQQPSLTQFKHALIQQAAYLSQPKAQRRTVHAQIAAILQERFPARAQHAPAQVAHHLHEAGLAEQALPLWQQAGRNARRISANREAADYFQRALDCLATLPPSPQRDGLELPLQLELGASLNSSAGYGAPTTLAAFSRALQLGQELQSHEAAFQALVGVWGCSSSHDQAYQLGQQVLLAAQQSGQVPLVLLGNMCTLGGAFWSQPLGESRAIAERIISLCPPPVREACLLGFGEDPLVNARTYLCLGLWVEGYPERAQAVCEELLADTRAHGSANAICHSLVFACMLHCLLRDPQRVAQMAEETLRHSRGKGLQLWEDIANVMVGWSRVHLGDALGLQDIQLGIDGNRRSMPVIEVTLATLHLDALTRLGEHQQVIDLAALTLQTAERRGDRYLLPEVLRLQTAALLALGREEQVAPTLDSAEQLARRMDARALLLRLAMQRADWRRDTASRAALHQVLESFDEGRDTPDLRDAQALLASLAAQA